MLKKILEQQNIKWCYKLLTLSVCLDIKYNNHTINYVWNKNSKQKMTNNKR